MQEKQWNKLIVPAGPKAMTEIHQLSPLPLILDDLILGQHWLVEFIWLVGDPRTSSEWSGLRLPCPCQAAVAAIACSLLLSNTQTHKGTPVNPLSSRHILPCPLNIVTILASHDNQG